MTTRPQALAGVTVAETYLATLRARGIERLFVNAGTDFAPLAEAYARRPVSELDFPDVVVCAHENLAVGMAHGAYLASGAIQGVMLHTNVGTANAICGIVNAVHDRVPILLTAGRTPLFEHAAPGARSSSIHWAQEMFDQAGMLREAVKWDYELRAGSQVETVVDRALDIALTEPRGPVYLTLPREVLAAPADDVAPHPATPPPSAAYPEPDAIRELARHLSTARFPVIVTASSGSDPDTVAVLDELCDRFAIGVVEQRPRRVNATAGRPMHLGYALAPLLADADVICCVDVDVPWIPARTAPADDAVVIHCGPDPHFGRYPMRTHRADLSITASNRHLFTALLAAMDEHATEIAPDRAQRIAARAQDIRSRTQRPTEPGTRIDKEMLNRALHEVRPAGSVLVSEYWVRPDLAPSTEPGSYFATPPAGGLGWGLPAALGVQLVRPDAVVIAAVGDGSYLFANPAACHQAMQMHGLPVLTVVCGNGRWGAVANSTLDVYPDGHAARSGALTPFARLDPAPAFERYAEASGGFGIRVTKPAELVPALSEALRVVTEQRRPALVNVECV